MYIYNGKRTYIIYNGRVYNLPFARTLCGRIFLAKSLPLFRSLFDRSRYECAVYSTAHVDHSGSKRRRIGKQRILVYVTTIALEEMFIDHVPTFIIIDMTAGHVLHLNVN